MNKIKEKQISNKEHYLEVKEKSLARCTGLGSKVLAKLSISHMQRQKVRYSFDR